MTKELREFINCDEITRFTVDDVVSLLGITKMEMAELISKDIHDPNCKSPFSKDIFIESSGFTCNKTDVYLFAVYLNKYTNCKILGDYIESWKQRE